MTEPTLAEQIAALLTMIEYAEQNVVQLERWGARADFAVVMLEGARHNLAALRAALVTLEASQTREAAIERLRGLIELYRAGWNTINDDGGRLIANAIREGRRQMREEAHATAIRYAENPPSSESNNTQEAFDQGMDHQMGCIDAADLIAEAIARLSDDPPAQEPPQ